MKGKQLTFPTLGGEVVTVHQRGKHYVQPRGYAYFPGTGPKGETCKTCRHAIKFRRWYKCDAASSRWTGGRGTDILAGAPACKYWSKISGDPTKGSNSTIMTEKEFLQLMADISNEH